MESLSYDGGDDDGDDADGKADDGGGDDDDGDDHGDHDGVGGFNDDIDDDITDSPRQPDIVSLDSTTEGGELIFFSLW